MPSPLRAAAKTAIRRAVRSRGYDLVPLAAGLTKLQLELLASTPTVVDVGANVGQYGERMRDLGFAGTVISFEPGSAAFAILQTKATRMSNWQVRQVALGSTDGSATLNIAGNSVSSSLLEVVELHVRAAPMSGTVATEQVRVSTLDSELADVAAPFYLKLDVQGLELAVLRGGPLTLSRTRAVQLEVSFDTLYAGQADWLELCGFLQRTGFVLRYLERGYEDPRSGWMLQADLLFVRAETDAVQ